MGDVSPRDYYDRQLRVPGWGPRGQEALGRARVLVVGVGGLGCPALASLARAGVGRLTFCDPDLVEASNLPRQTLFTPADVGMPKVTVAARELQRANPWITLDAQRIRVNPANVRSLVESADLVVDGTDNFATKFLLHDACRSAGVPFVLAALYQWEAQITAFRFRPKELGCWRCLYPTAPEDGCVGVCADVGVAGALASLAGNFQALAAVQILLGQDGPPHCTTTVIDAESWLPRQFRWKPAADCACQAGTGNWDWLKASPERQAPWDELEPHERDIVVDLRDKSEIQPGEWAFFTAQGSQVAHYPWSQWSHRSPTWNPERSYVLVCARGARSLAALRSVPPTIRAVSLEGGMFALAQRERDGARLA